MTSDLGADGAVVRRAFGQDQDLVFTLKTTTGAFSVIVFEADEAVNELYEIRLNLSSLDPDIDLHALMDSEASLAISSKYSPVRHLTGIVMDCARGDQGFARTAYQITLRPALARLAHVSDGRIWQQVSVVEVATQLLDEHQIHQVDWHLSESYPAREYLTQIPGERTLDFVRRILNEVGIFWYFDHQPDQCRLIFTDSPLTTPVLPHAPSVTYNNMPGGQSRGFWVSRFSQQERLRSSAVELGEYWFKNPQAAFGQAAGRQENNGSADAYPLYDYPGRYKDPQGVGKGFARVKIEAERVDATTGSGETNHIHLSPGWHTTIRDHPNPRINASHFLLSVRHKGQQATALQEDAPDTAATTYTARFTTMPAHLPYRPPAPHRPVMEGVQTGTVVGPEGEEIYCDEWGRVRVWLHFDRHPERRKGDGQRHEHSSCWIRVNQGWTGMSWGQVAIPRIGTEVLIGWLNGDVDQPVILGTARTATTLPPYKLPEHKTRMTIKSKTHKGTGFNELRFEDENGQEEVFIHAQKDMYTAVEDSAATVVEGNRKDVVKKNQSTVVSGNNHIITGQFRFEQIGYMDVKCVTPEVFALSYLENLSTRDSDWAGFNWSEKTEQYQIIKTIETMSQEPFSSYTYAKGDIISHSGVDQKHASSKDWSIDVAGNHSETVGGASSILVEESRVIAAGKNVEIYAGESLILSCGNSALELTQNGEIRISGSSIFLNANKISLDK